MKTNIEELKQKHGDIFRISVGGFSCIVRKPNRKDLSFASAMAKDSIKVNEYLLNSCWLEGDEEIKTNDELFYGATQRLNELIKIKEAELEKL